MLLQQETWTKLYNHIGELYQSETVFATAVIWAQIATQPVFCPFDPTYLVQRSDQLRCRPS